MRVSYTRIFMEDTDASGYFIKIGHWTWSNINTAGFFKIPVEKYEEIIKPFNAQYYQPIEHFENESYYYFITKEDVECAIATLKLITGC